MCMENGRGDTEQAAEPWSWGGTLRGVLLPLTNGMKTIFTFSKHAIPTLNLQNKA